MIARSKLSVAACVLAVTPLGVGTVAIAETGATAAGDLALQAAMQASAAETPMAGKANANAKDAVMKADAPDAGVEKTSATDVDADLSADASAAANTDATVKDMTGDAEATVKTTMDIRASGPAGESVSAAQLENATITRIENVGDTGTELLVITPNTVPSPDATPDPVGDTEAARRDADLRVESGNSPSDAPLAMATTKTSVDGIDVISGGIGDQEQERMNDVKGDYSLRMTFATAETGAYVPDVRVKIYESGESETLVDVVSGGPLLFVDLPAGSYTLKAIGYGQVKTEKVDVKSGAASELIFTWPTA